MNEISSVRATFQVSTDSTTTSVTFFLLFFVVVGHRNSSTFAWPNMAPKFNPGAKVFAKVRGYPPWPARIEGCADETPNKMKYHVYFYGTGETAVVKNQDVFDFVENKGKFGSVKKHKNFTEAMQQIEADLSPGQKAAIAAIDPDKEKTANKESKEAEIVPKEVKTIVESVSANETSASSPAPTTNRRASTTVKNVKPSPSTVVKPPAKEAVKRKLEVQSPSEDPITKKTKASPPGDKDKDAKPNSEIMSRSGRKIKPKKFSGFDDSTKDDNLTKEGASPSEKKIDDKKDKPVEEKKKETKKMRPKSLKDNDDADSNSGDWYLLATRGKENVKIPIKLNRPNFEDNKERSITLNGWENLVFEEARSLKKRIESGEEFSEADATDYMERFTKVKAASVFVLRSPEEEEQYRRETYNTESALLQIELQIRTALSLKGADTKTCLEQLDRLKNLNVTALMLKKHSQIVRTIKKLRRYVGNTICWNMTDEESDEFNANADKIRAKAEEIVNNFKTLFFQPTNASFWDHFSNELAEFKTKTKHMTMEDVFAIITEPE